MFNRHSSIVSLNSACIPAKAAMSFRPLNQQQMHKVYTPLYLQAYEEDISNSLAATDLRSELTLLCFDDKCKKSNEAFLSWKSKILELEELEDKKIEDSTKQLGLTATLATKTHMAHCLLQAKATKMSIMATQTRSASTMQWDGFYNIILAHAKLQDHSKSNISTKFQTNVNEQGRGSGQSGGRGQGAGIGRGGRTGRGIASTTTLTSSLILFLVQQ
jgi:hypothetical protein